MGDAKEIGGATYRIANLRGLRERTGNSAKQSTKQANAAKLQPAKINILSHLLSANQPSSSSLLDGAGRGAPGASCVGKCT